MLFPVQLTCVIAQASQLIRYSMQISHQLLVLKQSQLTHFVLLQLTPSLSSQAVSTDINVKELYS